MQAEAKLLDDYKKMLPTKPSDKQAADDRNLNVYDKLADA